MGVTLTDVTVHHQDWNKDRTLNGKWISFATVIRPKGLEPGWISSTGSLPDINITLELSDAEGNQAKQGANEPVVWVQPAHFSYLTIADGASEVSLDIRVREGAKVADNDLNFTVTTQFSANQLSFIHALLVGGMIPLK